MAENHTIKEIIERVKKNKRWPDVKIIQKAYNYALEKHGTQLRKSGEPYIIHPTNVAYTIAELGLDEQTICAALLHDVVEDTDATYEDIVSDSGFTHGEVMIRRSFYDRVGGYREEFKFSQDSDLWLRLIKISKFKTVKEILYVRHIQFSGISYKPDSFAAQAAFYEFARFVSGSADGGASLLTGLPDRNIFDVYSYERVDVQKRIFRGALRGVLFGDYIQAKEVAKKYVANKYKKIIVIFASVVLAGCFGKIINPVVRNIFGMKSHGYANLEKIEHI